MCGEITPAFPHRPKSPPNSPNTEMATFPEEAAMLRGVYINYYNKVRQWPLHHSPFLDWLSTYFGCLFLLAVHVLYVQHLPHQ